MGVSYLLDTNAFLWLVMGGRHRRPEVIAELQVADQVYVSAVSAFEVRTKQRLGKLPQARAIPEWSAAVSRLGAAELALSSTHSEHAGLLDWSHRDPFDRLLVAQALVESLTLVSADQAVLAAPGVRTLTW